MKKTAAGSGSLVLVFCYRFAMLTKRMTSLKPNRSCCPLTMKSPSPGSTTLMVFQEQQRLQKCGAFHKIKIKRTPNV